MRAFFRSILLRPILWLVNRYSSDPDRERIFSALSGLRQTMEHDPGKKGFMIPFNPESHRFIIFSDQHKGRKNGSDDFMAAEKAYIQALRFYNDNKFHFICLGDSEELWENTILQVMKQNQASFDLEKLFVVRDAFTKVVGNHDLDWEIDPLAANYLKKIYDTSVPIFQGLILQTSIGEKVLRIFCTHGHQGDLQSDGNWFSKFFVTKIWAPLQAWLRIYPNTPAYNDQLKTTHNKLMYEWAMQQKDLVLITGHTHQPVFGSLTHFERLQWEHRKALYEQNLEWAKAIEDEMKWRSVEDRSVADDYANIKPVYFNSGCCCFFDGNITGIEIAEGYIRLIEWKNVEGAIKRIVLEEQKLTDLIREL